MKLRSRTKNAGITDRHQRCSLKCLRRLMGGVGLVIPFCLSCLGIMPTAQAQDTLPKLSVIDPVAHDYLTRMVGSYRKLTSFSCTIHLPSLTATLLAKRPNRVVVSTSDEQVDHALAYPISRAVSDGFHYFAFSPRDRTRYLRQPLDPDEKVIGRAITAVTLGCVLRNLLGGNDPIQDVLSTDPSSHLQSLTCSGSGSLDGVPIETITAVLVGQGHEEGRLTFLIGREDYLLRRFTISASHSDGTLAIVRVENYTHVTANPLLPQKVFTFTHSPSAKSVIEFESLHNPALRVGAMPFAIQALDMKDHYFSLDQYKGKVILLDFWATWCMPCVAGIPDIAMTCRKYRARGFDVVSISADGTDRHDRLLAFIKTHGMDWRQIQDAQGMLSAQYGVKAYPFTLLIGRDGKIAAMDISGGRLAAAVSAAVNQK